MAIYHCSIKTFTRSAGQSAVAAAAYRSGKKLNDNRTGEVQDYTRRLGVVHTEIVLPPNSPRWAKDTEQLWNAVEAAEKRKNSTIAREFEIALPHELNEQQRLTLARAITKDLIDRFSFAAQFSIHKPDEEHSLNHHVHILASTRVLNADGFGEKTRELDQRTSGATLFVREMVADMINHHLEMAGLDARVDHRSLAAQQAEAIENGDIAKAIELGREPTRHVGKRPQFVSENRIHNDQVKSNHGQGKDQAATQIGLIAVEAKLQASLAKAEAGHPFPHREPSHSQNVQTTSPPGDGFGAIGVQDSNANSGLMIDGLLAQLEQQVSGLASALMKLPEGDPKRNRIKSQIANLKAQQNMLKAQMNRQFKSRVGQARSNHEHNFVTKQPSR